MSTSKQDQLIKLRCSKLEKDIIQANAIAAGMKTSAYLRELGLQGTSAISQGLYQAAQEPEVKLRLNVLANQLLQSLYELVQGISDNDLIQPECQRRFALFSISLLEARRAITLEGVECNQAFQTLSQAIYQILRPDLTPLKKEFDHED